MFWFIAFIICLIVCWSLAILGLIVDIAYKVFVKND